MDKIPAFQARCKDPEAFKFMYESSATLLDKEVSKEAKWSVYISLVALAFIVFFSVCGAVWQSGMVAVVAIYGIAWLADTYYCT